MFSRFFIVFFVIFAFFACLIAVRAQEEDANVEDRNPLIAAAARTLGKVFVKAAAECLTEAATECKDHLKKPKELIKCGGKYLKENKGRCLL